MKFPSVEILVISTCPQCKALQDMLASHDVPFRAVDIDLLAKKEREELLTQITPHNPQKAFPITMINGKAIIGFQKDILLMELGLK